MYIVQTCMYMFWHLQTHFFLLFTNKYIPCLNLYIPVCTADVRCSDAYEHYMKCTYTLRTPFNSVHTQLYSFGFGFLNCPAGWRLHLLLHTNYILHYMVCYTCHYMAHYMTSYIMIIMIGIQWWSWISLHELHWGYILCYMHVTISITWPVTSSITWSITLQITSSWLTLHELHWDYIFWYTPITYVITWPVTSRLHG